jgi:predicted site-specific integrase-resolvase
MRQSPEFEELLTPAQVGKALNLDPKTITRWAKKGVIDAVVLPSGHRRYRLSEVQRIHSGGAK